MGKSRKKDRIGAAAVEMGRRGGNKRAKNLTPERRSEIARQAAEARWGTRRITETPSD